MTGDPFGRAVRDWYRDEQTGPLVQRDGPETREHPIEQFYFTEFTGGDDGPGWLESHLEGPLLDLGAGAGRHALYFQERFETVALEVSEALVETMRDRGVADARQGDMFALRGAFDRDRFASALAIGTQVGLAGSVQGLRGFLGDLAAVTGPDGTAVVDGYDPGAAGTEDLLGYREDPTRGLAARVMSFEYDGDRGEILLFRLFSPDRVREATVGTGWTVTGERRPAADNDYYYLLALERA